MSHSQPACREHKRRTIHRPTRLLGVAVAAAADRLLHASEQPAPATVERQPGERGSAQATQQERTSLFEEHKQSEIASSYLTNFTANYFIRAVFTFKELAGKSRYRKKPPPTTTTARFRRRPSTTSSDNDKKSATKSSLVVGLRHCSLVSVARCRFGSGYFELLVLALQMPISATVAADDVAPGQQLSQFARLSLSVVCIRQLTISTKVRSGRRRR